MSSACAGWLFVTAPWLYTAEGEEPPLFEGENMDCQLYGLELTDNSKVGWAFGLSREHTCIHATTTCRALCYGNGIRYQSAAQKSKRERNYRTVEYLLERGGPELLAENLIALVDQVRPIDWLTAQIEQRPTAVPYSLRIHDVGDWHKVGYALAWQITIQARPQCKYWFYTRSFVEDGLLAALSALAELPNCQGFLSIDGDNFEQGLRAYVAYPGVWKLALLQEEAQNLPPRLLPRLQELVNEEPIINFPFHRGGHHVKPVIATPLVACPQITTDALPLHRSKYEPRPCQACQLCLPR